MLTKPKPAKITSEVVLVTPELAVKWLEGNVHNRPITQAKVDAYARDMKLGQWDLNGEAVIFDWNDTIQDGQHRLYACVEVGVPFQTLVTRGIDPATFKTIDTGKARSAKDVLGIKGYVNLTTLAAAAANVIRIQRGDPRSGAAIPNSEILAFVDANPDFVEWVDRARRGGGIESFSSIVSAVLFIGSKTHHERAVDFLMQFKRGENLQFGSPVLAVRNRLFADKKLTKIERMSLIILAWNAFVEGRTLSKSQLPDPGSFPTIKGSILTSRK